MEKGRIAALDAGRAIAVVGVVAVHLSFQFPNLPDSVALIARMGQYGVQLFFVISAITIFMTLEADRERFSAARHITLRFYIKRFFRIAPLYYVAIAIYGLISWGALRSGYERAWVLGAHSPADILLDVLFLHALSPSAINNVVPGGWSIGVEMLFYLLAPLIFFFTLNRVRLAIASVSVLAVSAAAMWLVGCNGAPDCNVANNTFLYFWPPVQSALLHRRNVGMVRVAAVSRRRGQRHASCRVAVGHDGVRVRARHSRARRMAPEGPRIFTILRGVCRGPVPAFSVFAPRARAPPPPC